MGFGGGLLILADGEGSWEKTSLFELKIEQARILPPLPDFLIFEEGRKDFIFPSKSETHEQFFTLSPLNQSNRCSLIPTKRRPRQTQIHERERNRHIDWQLFRAD